VGQHLNFQHRFSDVIEEVTYHCIWTIISVAVILCDYRILLERGIPYTLKSANKQLMHTFRHFVVSLPSRFYTLAQIFVFDVNIYSSSLRLIFKSDPVVSHLPANHRQYFILALSLPFRWHRVSFVFKYLYHVKIVIFHASDIILKSLLFYRNISRTEDFRNRYLYLLKVVEKIRCLRPTCIILRKSKWFEQNGLLLKGRLVNRNRSFWET
jgi:hypothetical protein